MTPQKFNTANGSDSAYDGITAPLTISLHDELEFDIDLLKVSSNEQFLILLGNDILSDNEVYKFRGVKRDGHEGYLKFVLL